MSSPNPKPGELANQLEEFSHKLDDYQRKFNPFFKQVSSELKNKVDGLLQKVEKYAHYGREHQLKHLLESHKVQTEILNIHSEIETVHLRINELDRIYRRGKFFT